jgi:hypothetical protein
MNFIELYKIERKLTEDEYRKNRVWLDGIIHDEFKEIISDGRVFEKTELIDILVSSDGGNMSCFDFEGVELASDCALITFKTKQESSDKSCARSSIWKNICGWKLMFHQATEIKK